MVFPDDIPTAVSDREAVKLARLARAGVVLELGSHFGYSTVVMAQTALRVHAVDWHRGDPDAGPEPTLSPFLKALGRYQVADRVVLHLGRFEDVLPYLASGTFDGVFLDGSHDFASVLQDTNAALRLVRDGGWLAWHDWGRFEVADAVHAAGVRGMVRITDHLAVAERVWASKILEGNDG